MALTLDYNFAEDKSLVARTGPTLDFTRASDGTYFDSAGVLQTATTDAARFDHDPSDSNKSLGLLVEEARTNLVLRSEEANHASWSNGFSGGVTVTADDANAPDGNATADKLTGIDLGNDALDQTLTLVASTQYVASWFIKNVDSATSQLTLYDNNLGATDANVRFTWAAGVPTASVNNGTDDFDIEDKGGGWYRIWIAWTTPGTVTTHRIMMAPDWDNGQKSIHVWGAGIELGAFPTSYIATVATSVTRALDAPLTATMTWLNATAPTFFIEASQPYVDIGSPSRLLEANDGGTTDRFFLNISVAQAFSAQMINSGGANANTGPANSISAGVVFRATAGFSQDDSIAAMDGTADASPETACDLPPADTLTQLLVGHAAGLVHFNGHFRALGQYDERLADDVIAALSLGPVAFPDFGVINADGAAPTAALFNITDWIGMGAGGGIRNDDDEVEMLVESFMKAV